MILQHFLGNGVLNFIRIAARVLWKILQKHFGLFFSEHTV